MILIVNICRERLHKFEFVKPIVDLLKSNGVDCYVKDYKKLSKGDFMNADKIIICGTSLKDEDYLKDYLYFSFVRGNKPVLGICGGMQLIGMNYDLKSQVDKLDIKNNFNHILKKKKEIGFYREKFDGDFLNVGNGKEIEVYHLHNNWVDFSNLNMFEVVCSGNEVVQAVRHKDKEIYGVLFHPEVRQKEMILEFSRL
jgi:anthranilate/para-aminobenzoate synthase component II